MVHRTYTCRGVLPLLSSELQVMFKDIKISGVSAFFQVLVILYNNLFKISMICFVLIMNTSIQQVSNENKSVTFFTNDEQETYAWAQSIEDTIRYYYMSITWISSTFLLRRLTMIFNHLRTENCKSHLLHLLFLQLHLNWGYHQPEEMNQKIQNHSICL